MNKGIMFSSIFLIAYIVTFPLLIIYKQEAISFGEDLLSKYSDGLAYIILFLFAVIGSTLIPLPVTPISMATVVMGFDVYISSIIIGLGATLGSCCTYILGRYFSHVGWVFQMLHHNEEKFSKAKCKLSKYGSFALFSIAISPLPGDLYYLACGLLEFPIALYFPIMLFARILRYMFVNIVTKITLCN